MTRLRVNPHVAIRALPDGDAVVARSDGVEAVIVNPTAHALLELLAEPGTETDVGDAFVTAFPREDAAAIKRDIRALIERFLRDGILEPCGSASSTA